MKLEYGSINPRCFGSHPYGIVPECLLCGAEELCEKKSPRERNRQYVRQHCRNYKGRQITVQPSSRRV